MIHVHETCHLMQRPLSVVVFLVVVFALLRCWCCFFVLAFTLTRAQGTDSSPASKEKNHKSFKKTLIPRHALSAKKHPKISFVCGG